MLVPSCRTGLARNLTTLLALLAWSLLPMPLHAAGKSDHVLPRILLIGDSISIGYTDSVVRALAGRASVTRAPDNCLHTEHGLKNLGRWLGHERWDIIHFNFGIHDVARRGGKKRTAIGQYGENLSTIVARLEKTGARLIWASTTPIQPGTPGFASEDVVAYNAVARKIMEERDIGIDDLYSFALPQLVGIQRPKNCHFLKIGYDALARQVTSSLLDALQKLTAAAPTPLPEER